MSKENGVKYDGDKPRWGLLPYREVQEVVDVLTFGSKKYTDDNWKYVDNAVERYYDAMLRHITQYRFADERGEMSLKNDAETGKNHLAHAICCALFIMWFDNEDMFDISDEFDNMFDVLDEDVLELVKPTQDESISHLSVELDNQEDEISLMSDRIKELEQIIVLNERENNRAVSELNANIEHYKALDDKHKKYLDSCRQRNILRSKPSNF